MQRSFVLSALLFLSSVAGMGLSYEARADDRPGNCSGATCERTQRQGNMLIITTDYYNNVYVSNVGWIWMYSHSTQRAIMVDERFEP